MTIGKETYQVSALMFTVSPIKWEPFGFCKPTFLLFKIILMLFLLRASYKIESELQSIHQGQINDPFLKKME